MNYFFVITRARKNKEGSCVMSRVAVLLRIHPWSWKRRVFYQWKCRERARERRVCACVCVSLCWWQWECLFLGPPPPLQIYSTSLPNAELRSPAPPTARPNTHSVFFILSFSQSHSSLCSLSSSWPRLPLALPARELETYRNEAVERERRDRVRHVGTHVTEVSGAGEGRRLYTVPTRRVTREETKGAEF